MLRHVRGHWIVPHRSRICFLITRNKAKRINIDPVEKGIVSVRLKGYTVDTFLIGNCIPYWPWKIDHAFAKDGKRLLGYLQGREANHPDAPPPEYLHALSDENGITVLWKNWNHDMAEPSAAVMLAFRMGYRTVCTNLEIPGAVPTRSSLLTLLRAPQPSVAGNPPLYFESWTILSFDHLLAEQRLEEKKALHCLISERDLDDQTCWRSRSASV